MEQREIIYGGLTDEQRIHLGSAIEQESEDYEIGCFPQMSKSPGVPFQVRVAEGENNEQFRVIAYLGKNQTAICVSSPEGKRLAEFLDSYEPLQNQCSSRD